MGFLDQKNRVLDVVLTDYGRELLAQNKLNFQYYAFSDEGIDYSGSLSRSLAASATLDNYIHRDVSFEADQRQTINDLRSFLYTIPQERRVLPEFKINADLTSSVELERKYAINEIIFENKKITVVEKPLDVVIRATVPKETLEKRTSDFVIAQKTQDLLSTLDKEDPVKTKAENVLNTLLKK
jgi:hypothetical protein